METQNNKTGKKMPGLIKMSSSYKMVVPQNVEEKIRYLLRKFPSTEWSGILFYSRQGNFEDGNLVITCRDIYPMDLGNATFTSFTMSEDVAGYMAENPQLFGYDLGLVHSHHQMKAFFSNTDLDTLQKEGSERNCFVSLIVNNEGTYSAAVTRNVKTTMNISIQNAECHYEFFGDGMVTTNSPTGDTVKSVEKEEIQFFMLDVERHAVNNTLEYLDRRFEEIEQKKEKRPWYDKYKDFSFPSPALEQIKKPKYKEGDLWDTKSKSIPAYKQQSPKEEHIDQIVKSIVTCSLDSGDNCFDLEAWMGADFDVLHEQVFGKGVALNNKFETWAEFIVDFLLMDCADPGKEAEAVMEELLPYAGNPYADYYIGILESYIEEPEISEQYE